MPNISITNYCNLKCSYCFANEMINEEKYNITKDEFCSILDFIHEDNGRIGIIGGEPTLHPEFEWILSMLKTIGDVFNKQSLIFSNGILIGKYAKYITDSIYCLINVNHPNIIGVDNFNRIKQSIKDIDNNGSISNLSIGINIYPDLPDYNYIFEIAKLAKSNTIRVGCCSPSGKYSNIEQDTYYKSIKEIYVNFVRDATDLGFEIILDCNRIPRCYFNEDDIIEDTKYLFDSKFLCNPIIDILPNMTATPCFGCYDCVDLNKFNSLFDVYRSFYHMQYKDRNILDKCNSCSYYEDNICQGGCLAFSKQRNRKSDL